MQRDANTLAKTYLKKHCFAEGWSGNYYHVGGGDNPLTSMMHFVYKYRPTFTSLFKLEPSKIVVPFADLGMLDLDLLNRQSYRDLTSMAPWHINNINILDWAQDTCRNNSSVTLDFVIDSSFEILYRGDIPEQKLEASFSDPKLATMFKLAFG
jgi:hypothetical protein